MASPGQPFHNPDLIPGTTVPKAFAASQPLGFRPSAAGPQRPSPYANEEQFHGWIRSQIDEWSAERALTVTFVGKPFQTAFQRETGYRPEKPSSWVIRFAAGSQIYTGTIREGRLHVTEHGRHISPITSEHDLDAAFVRFDALVAQGRDLSLRRAQRARFWERYRAGALAVGAIVLLSVVIAAVITFGG